MDSLARCELRKSLCNKWFSVALTVGCVLAVISVMRNIVLEYYWAEIGITFWDTKWMDFSSSSCFNYWLVVDGIQAATSLFFLLLPLLAALPYAWSYLEESKTGFIALIITRTTKMRYLLSKYLAVFLSGALTITIPIILNFLICACFVPARIPDVFADIHIGIFDVGLWSEVFYTNPLLYVVLYTLLNFTASGLWAASVFALSALTKTRVSLILAPWLALIFIDFVAKAVFWRVVRADLTPIGFLRGIGVGFPPNGTVVAVFLLFLLIISAAGVFTINRRDVL